MKNPEKPMFLFLILASTLTTPTISKSTIEPCSSTKEKCNSLLGYNLYTDLKPNQLASLFNVDPISILLSNSIEISDHVLPSNLFLKIPISCSCVDGIMKSTSTRYRTRVSDTLENISGSIYGGLVSPEQILAANPTLSFVDGTVKSTSTHYGTRDSDAVGTDYGSIYGGLVSPAKIPAANPSDSYVDGNAKSTSTHYIKRDSDTVGTISGSIYGGFVSPEQSLTAKAAKIEVGTTLVIPLPCACFNGTDDSSPAVYMSYVVRRVDTMSGIAKRFETTVADLINVNAMGAPDINPGDILAVPLLACGSNFPKYATDYGLIIPNGSYALTAEHCVQCSCSLGSRSMYCEPSSLDVSCSSMQCRNSKFMLGNITSQETSAGCKLTTCTYNGFANGTILTTLSMSLQPRCPGPLQLTPLLPPPDTVPKEPMYPPSPSPSPSPSEESDSGFVGGISSVPAASPRASTVASSNSIPGNPANGPGGSISTATCPSSYYSVLMYIASSCSFLVFLV